jgi:DNA-binding transcriptional LysR family regulator
MSERPPGRINLKHLHYFHEVAREGSLTGAARRLHLAPQTLSSQVRELEQSLGRKLLERSGRRLVLTPDGEVARDYAESIFALGTELGRVMAGRAEPRRQGLRLGVTDGVPKLLTARVLAPLLERYRDGIELDSVEGTVTGLLGRLAARQLDAVLADQPLPPHLARSMRGRLLLKSGLSLVAAPRVRTALDAQPQLAPVRSRDAEQRGAGFVRTPARVLPDRVDELGARRQDERGTRERERLLRLGRSQARVAGTFGDARVARVLA